MGGIMASRKARQLRKDPTLVERILWRILRKKNVDGHRFRRQHPLGTFIVDFVCLDKKLVIEVDGGQHMTDQKRDEKRTSWLAKSGYRTIRFWNHEVCENIEGVGRAVSLALESATPHLTPPPQGGRKEAIMK